MIEINKIVIVNTYSFDHIKIFWMCKDTFENLSNYKFDVLRSDSPGGNFEAIATNVTDFGFSDSDISFYTPSAVYYYKIIAKNTETGEVKISDVTGSMTFKQPDDIARAIAWQYKVFMDNVVKNPPIIYIPKKRFGTKCPDCWDDIRMQVTKTHCETCYGTRFSGGYGAPVYVKYSTQSMNSSMQGYMDMFDINDDMFSPLQIWIINDVIARPGDLVVKQDNTRFEVMVTTPSTKNGYVIRQTLDIQRLPETHVAYKLQIPGGDQNDNY